ncbi:MAG: hypothetical protein WA005_13180 [Candidatus Binataceae bacterium]
MLAEGGDTAVLRLMALAAVRAADALAAMLYDQVEVRDSRLYYGHCPVALSQRLRRAAPVVVAAQQALGITPLKVLVLVGTQQAGCMLDLLMGRHGHPHPAPGQIEIPIAMDPTRVDALREVANVATGACIAVLGRELGLTSVSPPVIAMESGVEALIGSVLPDAHALCAAACLATRTHQLAIDLWLSIAQRQSVGAASRI